MLEPSVPSECRWSSYALWGCKMIAFGKRFGGYGVPQGPTEPGFTDGRGWTNIVPHIILWFVCWLVLYNMFVITIIKTYSHHCNV